MGALVNKPIAMDGGGVAEGHNRPAAPDYLTAEALIEWNRLLDIPEFLAALEPNFYSSLAQYCYLHGRSVAAMKGQTECGPRGTRPIILSTADRYTLQKLAQEFGLTPAARSKMRSSEPPAKTNTWSDL